MLQKIHINISGDLSYLCILSPNMAEMTFPEAFPLIVFVETVRATEGLAFNSTSELGKLSKANRIITLLFSVPFVHESLIGPSFTSCGVHDIDISDDVQIQVRGRIYEQNTRTVLTCNKLQRIHQAKYHKQPPSPSRSSLGQHQHQNIYNRVTHNGVL